MDGIVVNYDNITPIPMITYNQSSNALAFSNPIKTTAGIASSETETLEFNSAALL